MIDLSGAIVQPLAHPLLSQQGVTLQVLRLDLIHPIISGNKWFKLRFYLQQAQEKGLEGILTFGGAWSNHIVATACATREVGLKSAGIIRGEASARPSTALLEAAAYGMQFTYLDRTAWRQKDDAAFLARLQQDYPHYLVVPEGGAGDTGIRGAATICDLISPISYSHIACALGSGTMFTGMAQRAPAACTMVGIPVLKGVEAYFDELIGRELKNGQLVDMQYGYHFGGYAKKDSTLLDFMNWLYRHCHIPTDFVYTGKLFYGLFDLLRQNHFAPGSTILAVHSGGLQGNRSLAPGTLGF